MAKGKTAEVKLILKSAESKSILSLYELYKDKKNIEPVLELLNSIKQNDLKKILDKAGGVNSMDKAIDTAVEQAFYRGRIAAFVLFLALLINAEEEAERRERSSKKKK